jgi:hypothetical protein
VPLSSQPVVADTGAGDKVPVGAGDKVPVTKVPVTKGAGDKVPVTDGKFTVIMYRKLLRYLPVRPLGCPKAVPCG